MSEAPLLSDRNGEARARAVIAVLSVVVLVSVGVVIYGLPARPAPGRPGMLPTVNAVLNAGNTLLLCVGYVMVKMRFLEAHRRCMLSAAAVSAAFLVTYLIHHAEVGSVPFRGQGSLRTLYFAVLIPHIVLAAAVVPLALLTLYRGLKRRFALHKRIARFTLPLWLYVSVSGVLVYLLQYHVVE